MSQLSTEYPLWWLPLCMLLGTGISYALYHRPGPWPERLRWTLFGLRAALFSLLLALLLGPSLRSMQHFEEPPTIALAIDNSGSIPLVIGQKALQAQLGQLQQLATSLQQAGYRVAWKQLQGNASETPPQAADFRSPSTDLSQMLLELQQAYENQHLSGIVLLSDGLYNQGRSPLDLPLSAPIHTLAVGDSTPKVDGSVYAIRANRLAYQGNKFPLQAEIAHHGLQGRQAKVSLWLNGKLVEEQLLSLGPNRQLQRVSFLVEAKQKGLQQYQVRMQPLQGEFTQANNQKSVYIDVLDGKEKILLVSPTPHPDIKAIRSAIEENKNMELQVHVPGMNGPGYVPFSEEEKYSLAILLGSPDKGGDTQGVVNKLLAKRVPLWFVLTPQTDLSQFNKLNGLMRLQPSGEQTDKVTAKGNEQFELFGLEEGQSALIEQLPPLDAPFGQYQLTGEATPLLFQRVGSVTTGRPLWVLGEQSGQKSAVLTGSGLWLWRQHEYLLHEQHSALDGLVLKTLQYLSSKEDRRRFKVYPQKEEYAEGEGVVFETEAYNKLYEPVYGQQVKLSLQGADGKKREYAYVNSHDGFLYQVSGLAPGIYRYEARTTLEGKPERSDGSFSVRELSLEALNTTADFNLLRNLSQQSGGSFQTETAPLLELLKKRKPASLLHAQEQVSEFVGLGWVLALLLGLSTLEWGLRKWKGGY